MNLPFKCKDTCDYTFITSARCSEEPHNREGCCCYCYVCLCVCLALLLAKSPVACCCWFLPTLARLSYCWFRRTWPSAELTAQHNAMEHQSFITELPHCRNPRQFPFNIRFYLISGVDCILILYTGTVVLRSKQLQKMIDDFPKCDKATSIRSSCIVRT